MPSTSHQISLIKWTVELVCAFNSLKFSSFFSKFEPFLFGVQFLGHFCTYLVTDKIISSLLMVCSSCKTSYNILSRSPVKKWKWRQVHSLSCENEFYLHENEKSFPYQRLSTYPRFETEARGNSEMAYFPSTWSAKRQWANHGAYSNPGTRVRAENKDFNWRCFEDGLN